MSEFEDVISVRDMMSSKPSLTSLSSWMADLPPELRSMPVTQIAIPGSHDTTTYHADLSAGLAVDVDLPQFLIKIIDSLGKPAMKYIQRNYSRTQYHSVSEQLNLGIRYLDLRLCERHDELWTLHGLYCIRLNDIFTQIKDFLKVNDKEILLLDFNHFYNMKAKDFELLCRMLGDFKEILCPKQASLDELSLEKMYAEGWRIIVFYNHAIWSSECEYLWPDSLYCHSPWADTMNEDFLIKFLDKTLAGRRPNSFHVSQGILTPTVGFIVRNFWKSVEKMRRRVRTPLLAWLKRQNIGRGGLNLVITDYVDREYVSAVIQLNYKTI